MIDHPENSEEYKGLQVNAGVEPVSIVDRKSRERIHQMRRIINLDSHRSGFNDRIPL